MLASESGATVVPEAFEHGAWFCSNDRCVLHVRAGDPRVHGSGEWATRSDGFIVSRRQVQGRMLCDRCARQVEGGT